MCVYTYTMRWTTQLTKYDLASLTDQLCSILATVSSIYHLWNHTQMFIFNKLLKAIRHREKQYSVHIPTSWPLSHVSFMANCSSSKNWHKEEALFLYKSTTFTMTLLVKYLKYFTSQMSNEFKGWFFLRAEELAQWCTVLAEDSSSVPSIHYRELSLLPVSLTAGNAMPSAGLYGHLHLCLQTQAQIHTYIHKIKNRDFFL